MLERVPPRPPRRTPADATICTSSLRIRHPLTAVHIPVRVELSRTEQSLSNSSRAQAVAESRTRHLLIPGCLNRADNRPGPRQADLTRRLQEPAVLLAEQRRSFLCRTLFAERSSRDMAVTKWRDAVALIGEPRGPGSPRTRPAARLRACAGAGARRILPKLPVTLGASRRSGVPFGSAWHVHESERRNADVDDRVTDG
jgi:hypothetical protein